MGASTRAGPWPATACGCALVLAVTLTGCGGSGSGGSDDSRGSGDSSPSASGPGPNSPTPQAPSPVRLCTDLISYWAEQDLAGSRWAGLDWEQKGLSNQQYEIYDDIVHAARAERRRHGTPAANALIKRLAERRCAAANGATHSSENWRPPT
ncbi:hypothetical protein ACFV27_19455 [Streptomyces antimycoticus]|uniref:hypothetical protein n=1 Tax=Streptomyces TaxID=1883 RepID=UPI000F78CF6A|nr:MULTISPECIES: hypothetical protein [Streptomyces]RSS37980.1 hypothetical protein EF902_31495 [Streptomyces sp. WAC05858]WJE00243.1 hypothetical protein QR300_31965 [Streptomyces antimycoticus]WTA81014.1 hypothetical protein OG751_14540 [Streptomyces antimycoticus]WTB08546.1 hypothetical protein OG546_32545 [Streptomyces antimycoticus]